MLLGAWSDGSHILARTRGEVRSQASGQCPTQANPNEIVILSVAKDLLFAGSNSNSPRWVLLRRYRVRKTLEGNAAGFSKVGLGNLQLAGNPTASFASACGTGVATILAGMSGQAPAFNPCLIRLKMVLRFCAITLSQAILPIMGK
jgi:hypothetical protein